MDPKISPCEREIQIFQVSITFAEKQLFTYLKENDAENISIVTIVHSSSKYSYEFVEWNGYSYDMCKNQVLSYKLSKEAYVIKLEKNGL